jgi:CheY-like chemotaxis protein
VTSSQEGEIAYQDIDVAIFEPTPQMRTLVRSTLLTVGFRQIHECHSVDDVIRQLGSNTIDLLLVDIDSATDGICRVVRQIRDGLVGHDPYIAIMALTSNPVPAMIKRTLEVGSDDLITRPISPKLIAERTVNLVHNRKDFVVTVGYIGPDRRRRDRNDANDAPRIKVPNALRYKAIGDQASAADTEALDAARDVIIKHRVARNALQISHDALKLRSHIAGGNNAKIETVHYSGLIDLIVEGAKLIARGKLAELESIGESMAKIAKSIVASKTLNESTLAVLHLHSEAISATINDDEVAENMVAAALGHPVDVSAKEDPESDAA